jgi:hypothetical protein
MLTFMTVLKYGLGKHMWDVPLADFMAQFPKVCNSNYHPIKVPG